MAPLTVVAVGAYGKSLLPTGAAPEVVLLVPERGRERGEAERMASHLVVALRSIGLCCLATLSLRLRAFGLASA